MMKMNVQLIQAFQFLSQFLLNICYKPGRFNIVTDAFLRLPSNNTLTKTISPKFNKLDALYTYNTTLVQINDSFAIKICKRYNNNLAWNKTKRVLETNYLLGPNVTDLLFEFGLPQPSSALIIYTLLIFHKDKFLVERHLCIPPACLGDLFKIIYNGNIHPGFAKAFNLVQQS